MGRRLRKRRAELPPEKSYYKLDEIRDYLRDKKKYVIARDARQSAYKDFGWKQADIVAALLLLQPNHFYKQEPHKYERGIMVDYYKASGINGENIYTHFHINDEEDKLIINSFKQLQE